MKLIRFTLLLKKRFFILSHYLRRVFPLLILLVYFGVTGQTQVRALTEHITIETGLLNNHVFQTFQDHRQFIWVIAGNSLDFYDGNQFVSTLTWASGNAELRFEDWEGRLWLKLNDHGKIRFYLVDSKTFKITNLTELLGKQYTDQVFDAALGKDHSIWIATNKGELWHYQPTSSTNHSAIRFISVYSQGKFVFLNRNIIDKEFWIGYERTINTGRTSVFSRINQVGKVIHQVSIEDILKSKPLSNDRIAFITLDKLNVLHANGSISSKSLKVLIPDLKKKLDHISNDLEVTQDQNEIFYIYKGRLIWFKLSDTTITRSDKDFFCKDIVNNFHVLIDKSNIIWVATINGLYKIIITRNRFENHCVNNNQENEEQDNLNSCRGIVADQNGTIYAAVNGNIYKKNRDSRIFEFVLGFPFPVYGLAIENNRYLWIARSYLIRYDLKTGVSTSFYPPEAFSFGLIWSVFLDKDRIWLGHTKALAYLDVLKQQIVPFLKFNNFNSLKGAQIYQITPIQKQNTLLLTTDFGLFELDREKGVLARYWTGGKGRYHLPVDNIQYLYQANKDKFWLATTKGLVRWNAKTSDFALYNRASGFPDENIYAVYPDKYGFLWLSTDLGIIQFHIKTGKFRSFTSSDGLSHNESNRISHGQGENGSLYFGSLNGINELQPRLFGDFFESARYKTFLVEAKAYRKNQTVPLDKLPYFYQHDNTLVLSPSEYTLRLRFGFPFYSKNLKLNKYEYKIAGLQNTWQAATSLSFVLPALKPGRYEFDFRSRLTNGENDVCRVFIRVLPPFYQQVWFLVLVFLIFVLGIYFFANRREQLLREQQLYLEKEIKKSTQKIQEDKAIIELQAEKLADLNAYQNRFFANMTHELRTPLMLISTPLNKLLDINGFQKDGKKLIKIAIRNADRLSKLVNEILSFSSFKVEKQTTEYKSINLPSFLAKMALEYQEIANFKRIKIRFENCKEDSNIVLFTDEKKLEILLGNLISNAIKYTGAKGYVNIQAIKEEDHQVTICIKDNGRGIHPIDQAHIFERFYQSQLKDAPIEGGVGIGLSVASEIAALLGGRISFVSKWGEGSTFSIALPQNQAPKIVDPLPTTFNADSKVSTPSITHQGYKPRVLVVDDNCDLAYLLDFILKQDFQVFKAFNGEDALVFLQSNPLPDIIICDIMMPLMDGFQLVERLKSTPAFAFIPVFMLTARSRESDRQQALILGVDEYIFKPFDVDELLHLLGGLLKRLPKPDMEDDQLVLSDNLKIASVLQHSSDDIIWLREFERLILEQLADIDFSVLKLAQSLSMSKNTFYRRLYKLTGLKPLDYIQEARLTLARKLLESGTCKDISEVLQRIGLKDASAFSTVFKKRFGKSPASFF
jgi:signal transduction histidine kinase/CheY-like chemotaxis protein/AraC-like DNA-binding protein/ligand-binding sensor domain-containing protein